MNLKIKKNCLIKELKKRKLYNQFKLYKDMYVTHAKIGEPPYECEFLISLDLEEEFDTIQFTLTNDIPINKQKKTIEYCNDLNNESMFTFFVYENNLGLQSTSYNPRFFDEKSFVDLILEMQDELERYYIPILKLIKE